jgi:hypothetical protein
MEEREPHDSHERRVGEADRDQFFKREPRADRHAVNRTTRSPVMRPQVSPAHIPQRVGSRRAATPVPNRTTARSASLSGYVLFLGDGEPPVRCILFPRNLGRPTVSASLTTGPGGGLTRTLLAPSRRRACVERRTQAHGAVTVLRRQRSGTARTAGTRSRANASKPLCIIGCTVDYDKGAANDSPGTRPFHGGESPWPNQWSLRC